VYRIQLVFSFLKISAIIAIRQFCIGVKLISLYIIICFGIGGFSPDVVVAVLFCLVCVWALAPFLLLFVFICLFCLMWDDIYI
jgi:hypothetical protein